jgi:glycosyltransferase involved in cell wall biosynthesis/SAM-dependent methyltransferase
LIRVGLVLGTSSLGNVNYYRNLLGAVLAQPDRRIEPVLLLGEHLDEAVLAGMPPLEVIRSPWLDPLTPRWAVRKIWQQVLASDPLLERLLRSHGIDVLSHSDFLGKQASIPAVCWIGDLQHRQLPQFFSPSERLYRDRDFRMQCRHATRILVSSHAVQRALAEFEGSSTEKTRVLQFVAQPRSDGEPTDRSTLEGQYGFSGPYFHVPNQFWAHKNHDLILDALGILKERGEPVLVLSTGATEDYRQPAFFGSLMARAERLGLADQFRALGVIPYRDLVGLMTNAVALINPSRAEGWSTSVEEAKSLGKRIVLSDIPVHREQAPLDGVFVDPDDPNDLASAMLGVLSAFDPAAEQQRAVRAGLELPARVRAFADEYQEIILEAESDRLARPRSTSRRRASTHAPAPANPLEEMAVRCPSCGGNLSRSSGRWSCELCTWTSADVDGLAILLPDVSSGEHDDNGHQHVHKAAQAMHFDRDAEEAFETNRPHGTPRLYQFLLHEKVRRAVAPIRSHLVGATALTVCGGSGMDAEYLARYGASVVSSDLSVGAAARARARFAGRELKARSVVADVEHLPFKDRSVDLVAVHDGLHHLEDPHAGLSEMARVARRWVVITEPAQAWITRLAIRLGLALEVEAAGNRVIRMEPSRTASFLETQGFVVLRAERYAMYYPHHPGSVFRLLSRPYLFPIVVTGWRLVNALIGRYGNKMVVVAERRHLNAIDSGDPDGVAPAQPGTGP